MFKQNKFPKMIENGNNRVFIHISLKLGEVEQIEVIRKLQTFTYKVLLAVFMSWKDYIYFAID